MEKDFTAINDILMGEFNQYIFDHPEVLEKIPQGALIVLQLEGDEGFNAWSKRVAEVNRESDQPIVYFRILKLAPPRSRILDAELIAV